MTQLGVVKLCAHKELIDMAKGSIGKHLPPFTRLNLLFSDNRMTQRVFKDQ